MNKLILDANAFIKDIDFNPLSTKYSFYTHPAVLSEVKDERARMRLNQFLYPLKFDTPNEKAIRIIKNFATQTGDIASLSEIDIELIALAYTQIESMGQLDLIKTTPLKPLEFDKIKNIVSGTKNQKEEKNMDNKQEQEENDKESKMEENNYNDQHNQNNENNQEQEENPIENNDNDEDDEWIEVVPKYQKKEEPESDDDSDDGEGWINSENLTEMKNEIQIEEENAVPVSVSVLTSDFAMQNVLLQMGIPIISADGYRIKSAKRFILECHVDKTLVRDPNKYFCPVCGNNSLLKVSCSLNSDGTIVLYRKKNFEINTRGFQYDIPTKTSKKEAPFVYCEDQLQKGGFQQQLMRQKKQEDYKYKKAMMNYENGMGFEESEFRKPKPKITIGYGKLNPNDVNDMRKIKRMKKQK